MSIHEVEETLKCLYNIRFFGILIVIMLYKSKLFFRDAPNLKEVILVITYMKRDGEGNDRERER